MTTIRLPMPPSLNNAYPTNKQGRRYKSPRLVAWEQEAWYALLAQKPPKIKGPVRLEYLYNEDETKADLGNLEKIPTDLLVKHGVIEDDRKSIVRDIRKRWAMGVKGCVVTIIDLRAQNAAELEYIGEGE